MHLRINSHSGFTKAPAPPPTDSSQVVPGGYADCPCNLNHENPDHSRRKRSLYVFLNNDLRPSRITNNKLKNRMHVDPHISQPTECRTNPFMTFALPHTFSIDLLHTSQRKHSPPSEPRAKKPFRNGYGHTLIRSPNPGPSHAFWRNQQLYPFHNQISFDT